MDSPYRHWTYFEATSGALAGVKGAARHQQGWTPGGLPDRNWITADQYEAAVDQAGRHCVGKQELLAQQLAPCAAPLPTMKQREAMGFDLAAERRLAWRIALITKACAHIPHRINRYRTPIDEMLERFDFIERRARSGRGNARQRKKRLQKFLRQEVLREEDWDA